MLKDIWREAPSLWVAYILSWKSNFNPENIKLFSGWYRVSLSVSIRSNYKTATKHANLNERTSTSSFISNLRQADSLTNEHIIPAEVVLPLKIWHSNLFTTYSSTPSLSKNNIKRFRIYRLKQTLRIFRVFVLSPVHKTANLKIGNIIKKQMAVRDSTITSSTANLLHR